MAAATPPTHNVVLTGRRRWAALFALALGVAMIILDATVVNVAIPTMVRDLDLTTNDAEWVSAAYSLVFASLLIVAGRLADRQGRRRMFVIGVIIFVLASVLVALSGNAVEIIGARALQGLGAAFILPSSLSIINAVFVGKSRAAAFAVWGATIGGMAALGPLVGGWLTTYASWHWAFLINVPIGILVLIGVFMFVPETKELVQQKGSDIGGIALSTLGLLGVVFALIEGQRYGWITSTAPFSVLGITWDGGLSPAFIAGIFGVICLVLMIVVEKRRLNAGKVVVFDLNLFKIRSFGAGNAVALIVSLGEFGLLFALPLFLQSVIGYTALETGVILLALAIGSFVASGAGAALSQRIGPVRVLQIGMACEAVGIIGLGVMISTSVTGWALAPWLFLYGMGVGFATAQLTGVILSETPVEKSGQASAMQSTSRQVGAAIGTAILGTTLLVGLGVNVTNQLEERNVAPPVAEQVTTAVQQSAGTVIPTLSQQPNGEVLVEGASEGYAESTKWVAWVAAAFVILGLLTTLLLPRNAARVESEGYAPPGSE
ncbi:MAG: MFS transporter [Actinomycetales bacterium mxb001]|nr:MAG: MFS transporter [Actinomycetales bacterium mxb001]